MELSSPIIKKLVIVFNTNFSLQNVSYIFCRKKTALKKYILFREMQLPSLKLKKHLCFFKRVFLYFRRACKAL